VSLRTGAVDAALSLTGSGAVDVRPTSSVRLTVIRSIGCTLSRFVG
jgi:hypothetical protein